MSGVTICAACNRNPLHPVEAACCNSLYCWNCIANCTNCTICRAAILHEECIPVDKNEQVVACPYCDKHLENERYETHESTCEQAPVPCYYCNSLFARINLRVIFQLSTNSILEFSLILYYF